MNRRLAAAAGAVLAAVLVLGAAGTPDRRAASTVELRAVLATVAPASVTTTTSTPAGSAAARSVVASCDVAAVQQLAAVPTTAWRSASGSECVVYPDLVGGATAPRYYLGPAKVTTTGVRNARAELVAGQGWTVRLRLTKAGSSAWDHLAQQQFHHQVAITYRGSVVASPTIQPNDETFTSFGGTAVISGAFGRREAAALAAAATPTDRR